MVNIYGFWISPTGEIHTILDDFGHKKFMESLLNKQLDNEVSEETSLFDEGWIRIVNTKKTFMVNYRCITCRAQLTALKEVEQQLNKDGYFHESFILDYGYDYHFFDSLNSLLRRIRERLYDV